MSTVEHLGARTAPDESGSTVGAIAPGVSTPTRRAEGRRLSTIFVALVALLPFAVGAWSLVARGYAPGALFGDRALLALSAHDAWSAPVLLGPYSRFYWHHPGPAYFYVLNVMGNLFGGQTVGLVLAAVCINVASAGAVLLLAFRRGGRWLVMWAALLLTVYVVAIEPIPFDIWNPSVTLLPFALVLLLAWSVAVRDWWMAPWLVLVGSFVVQTHVGLAPGVAMALVFAVVVGRVAAAPTEEAAERRRAALAPPCGARECRARLPGLAPAPDPAVRELGRATSPCCTSSSRSRGARIRSPRGWTTPRSRPRCCCGLSSNRSRSSPMRTRALQWRSASAPSQWSAPRSWHGRPAPRTSSSC